MTRCASCGEQHRDKQDEHYCPWCGYRWPEERDAEEELLTRREAEGDAGREIA